ncbi:hypothetical protein M3Y97_00594700 [Aphelenchoides bicaudatus]|nr:hypothetical protein M3Y97_00594700 [Aphelenchoides bicaudatus]
MDNKPPRFRVYKPNAMFGTLRRLHVQNLESQGLNNLTEAFQSFMTRARYLTMGNLRRTWSHGAVEFMKYRRLLPMLVADEHDIGSAFDDFDLSDRAKFLVSTGKNDDRKVTVSNVSNRVTASQLQSFFSKFGKVQSAHFPTNDRRQSMYATLPKHPKKSLTLTVVFKDEKSVERAKNATPQELSFYGQTMLVSNYIPSRRRTTSNQTSTESQSGGIAFGIAPKQQPDEGRLSRSSSALSVSSSGTLSSQIFPLDELPARALEAIFSQLGAIDRIRLERTNKAWLEASTKSWSHCDRLSFIEDSDLNGFFTSTNPLRNSHLSAFLYRCAMHLKSLDISSTNNFLDDKAVEQISQLCPNLEELDISGVHASSAALQTLTESLSKLTSIAYREMPTSNERNFWYLFKNGRSLKHVDLRGCCRLKGRCFALFGVELEEILLDGCASIRDDVIEEICNRCKNVKVLKLNGCYRLTDQALSLISRHLTELTSFSLAGEDFYQLLTLLDFNPAVNSDFIRAISSNLKNLKFLSLAFAGSDTIIDSDSLVTLSQLKELTELDLSGLAAVNTEVLLSICNGCTKLTKLTLRSCIYLGDDGVKALEKLEHLELIDISGCLLVGSVAIQHLISAFSTNKKPDGHSITLCIGGTVCEGHMVRCRNTRINLDLDDYSKTGSVKKFIESLGNLENETTEGDGNISDDGFGVLSAHRSFVADALTVEEEDMPNDSKLMEWAEKEAKNLGLLDQKK